MCCHSSRMADLPTAIGSALGSRTAPSAYNATMSYRFVSVTAFWSAVSAALRARLESEALSVPIGAQEVNANARSRRRMRFRIAVLRIARILMCRLTPELSQTA